MISTTNNSSRRRLGEIGDHDHIILTHHAIRNLPKSSDIRMPQKNQTSSDSTPWFREHVLYCPWRPHVTVMPETDIIFVSNTPIIHIGCSKADQFFRPLKSWDYDSANEPGLPSGLFRWFCMEAPSDRVEPYLRSAKRSDSCHTLCLEHHHLLSDTWAWHMRLASYEYKQTTTKGARRWSTTPLPDVRCR